MSNNQLSVPGRRRLAGEDVGVWTTTEAVGALGYLLESLCSFFAGDVTKG